MSHVDPAGARIARLDGPDVDLIALTLKTPGHTQILVVRLSGATRGVCLASDRPRGKPASPAISKLRHHVHGARISAGRRIGRETLVLELETRGRASALVLELGRTAGNATVVDAQGATLASLHRHAGREAPLSADAIGPCPWATDLEGLRAAAGSVLNAHEPTGLSAQRTSLMTAVKRARARLLRRLAAIERDLAGRAEIARLRRDANALLAALHTLPSDAREVSVADYASEDPTDLTLSIQPGLTPRRQADEWFTRARKLETGLRIASDRHALTEREIASLSQLAEAIKTAATDEQLALLRARAQDLGVAGARSTSEPRKRAPAVHRPFREFVGAFGRPIRVGKGATDNDALTLHHAAPHDLWLHARGTPGAHVVVPLKRGETCPPELLADAALLAAHFSKLRNDSTIDISHASRRHVRKPKGASAGSVTLQREKVFSLHPDPERLAWLLKQERSLD